MRIGHTLFMSISLIAVSVPSSEPAVAAKGDKAPVYVILWFDTEYSRSMRRDLTQGIDVALEK